MIGSDKVQNYFNDSDCLAITERTEFEFQRTVSYILSQNILFDNAKVLVLGCGSGDIEHELCNHYHLTQITLVDFSNFYLKMAESKLKYAELICCDLRNEYEKITGTYDVIYSISVAQYLSEDELKSLNNHLLGLLSNKGVITHYNVPDRRRRFLYRINNAIVLENFKYCSSSYDFIDRYSRWCRRSEFLHPNAITNFITPSIDWERFDAVIKKI